MRMAFAPTAACVCLLLGGAAAAAETDPVSGATTRIKTLTQTASLEAEAKGAPAEVYAAGPDRAGHGALELVRRIAFEPFDPARGRLTGVRLEVELAVTHAYSGAVSDGLPLDEAPEAVAVAPQLVSRVAVTVGEGQTAVAAVQSGTPSGCTADGSCMFDHSERFTVSGVAEDGAGLPAAEVFSEGATEAVVRLALDTLVDPATQICGAGGSWYRCTVEDLRIAVEVPENGIRLHYDYVPVAGAPTASMGAVQMLGNPDFQVLAGIAAAVFAALAGIAAVSLLRFDA